jgi:plastocyanin
MSTSAARVSNRRLWWLAIVPSAAALAVTATFAFSASNDATDNKADIVTIRDFAFHPVIITVAPGAKVMVSNHDATAHTLTATGGNFTTGRINGDMSASIIAPVKPGTYTYHCSIHAYMHGVLQVRA